MNVSTSAIPKVANQSISGAKPAASVQANKSANGTFALPKGNAA